MSHRFRVTNAMRFSLAGLIALVGSNCALSDKYYIEQGVGGNAAGHRGGTAGRASGGSSALAGSTNAGRAAIVSEEGGIGNAGATAGELSGGAAGDSSIEITASAGTKSEINPCDNGTCSGTCCGGQCVELSSNPDHCGQCGKACPSGRNCRASTCYGWTTMAPAPAAFEPREKAASTVVDGKLFIFGGLDDAGNALGDGAVYDVASNTWTMIADADAAPSPRQLATAIWTGLRVFVVGGRAAASALAYQDGARYTPTDGTWITLTPLSVQRVAPFAAAGPDYALVWGGLSASGTALSGGERWAYTGGTYPGTWTTLNSGTSAPDRATDAAWATSSASAFLFGGRINGTTKTNRGFAFTFSSTSWALLPTGPSARWGAFATHDGSAYFLWGGRDDTLALGDGYRFSTTWTSVSGTNAPTARWAPHRRTGWAFTLASGDVIVIGGLDFAGNPLTDGGSYSRTTDSWSAIEPWHSRQAHDYGVAAAINGEVLVWGGRNGAVLTNTGERYLP